MIILWRTARRRKPDAAGRRIFRTRQVTRVALIAVLVLRAAVATPQDVTEAALKAAFVYHFTKFTDWPSDALPPGAPLVACVGGDRAIAEALDKQVRGRDHAGHRIVVRPLDESAQATGCHVLYLTRYSAADITRVLTPLRDQPVLTLSDVDGFTRMGGIGYFYFEHAQLRFFVDTAVLKRTRLDVSSRLLQLSKRPW